MESVGRERSIEGTEFHKQGIRQVNELPSANEENRIRLNLTDLAKRVLDEQKENCCVIGKLLVYVWF